MKLPVVAAMGMWILTSTRLELFLADLIRSVFRLFIFPLPGKRT